MRWMKLCIFILLLIFYSSFLFHKISFHTDDLGRHLKNGELILQGDFKILTTNVYSFSEPSQAYVNDHWLFGVIIYPLFNVFGFNGLIILAVIILLATFSLLFYLAVDKNDFWLTAFFSLPVILILRERTDVRPEIFSYLFIVLFLYLLLDFKKYPQRKRIFWLIPLQLLWVNIHTFFIIGIMLVAGFLAEQIIVNRGNLKNNPFINKLVIVFLSVIAVNLLNPNGVAGLARPVTRFLSYTLPVTEDQPLLNTLFIRPLQDWSAVIFIPLSVVLLASFILAWKKNRFSIFAFLAGTGTVVVGFFMIRCVTFFGLLFLPIFVNNCNDDFIKLRVKLSEKFPSAEKFLIKRLVAFLVMGVIIVLIFLGATGRISDYNQPGLGLHTNSNGAANFFKENNLRGPIFNDAAVGSYLIWHLYPAEKVFLDNRHADAYSEHFITGIYAPILTDENIWGDMLKRYQFNVLLLYHYSEMFNERDFVFRRVNDPQWAVVYVDNNNIVLLRRDSPQNQDVINKFAITADNVEEKIKYLSVSDDISENIAAADIFNLFNRKDLALSLFQKIIIKQPKNSQIWRVMGETAALNNSQKSDVLAEIYLQRAIDLGEENARAYSYLGLVYLRLGQFEKSEVVLNRALKLEPGRADAQKYLDKLQEYKTGNSSSTLTEIK